MGYIKSLVIKQVNHVDGVAKSRLQLSHNSNCSSGLLLLTESWQTWLRDTYFLKNLESVIMK